MPQKHGKKATGKREENQTRLSYPEREQARSKIKEKVLRKRKRFWFSLLSLNCDLFSVLDINAAFQRGISFRTDALTSQVVDCIVNCLLSVVRCL